MRTVNGVEKFSKKNAKTSIAYASGVFAVVNSPGSNFLSTADRCNIYLFKKWQNRKPTKSIFRINLMAFQLLFNDLFDINLRSTNHSINSNRNKWVWHKIHIGNWWKQFKSHVFITQLTKPKIPALTEYLVHRYVQCWLENWCCALRQPLHCMRQLHCFHRISPCCCRSRPSLLLLLLSRAVVVREKNYFFVNRHRFCVFHVFVHRTFHSLIDFVPMMSTVQWMRMGILFWILCSCYFYFGCARMTSTQNWPNGCEFYSFYFLLWFRCL